MKNADRRIELGTQPAIGNIHTVLCPNFIGPERRPPTPGKPVPGGMNWDMWCNQTELRPYHPQLQFGWAKWWDYDCGGKSWGVSGWGTHALDQVQAALGTDDTGPVELWPDGTDEQGIMKEFFGNPSSTYLVLPNVDSSVRSVSAQTKQSCGPHCCHTERERERDCSRE